MVYTAALGVWLGALVAVGGTAAVAFPTMKALAPALPGFRVPAEDHWSIAAGHVMNPAFFALMIGGVALALISLCAWRGMGRGRRFLTVLSLLLAAGTLVGLGLPMRGHLDRYWAAARAGEAETASAAKARFDALHPWSSRALGVQTALVVTGLAAAVIARPRSVTPPPGGDPA